MIRLSFPELNKGSSHIPPLPSWAFLFLKSGWLRFPSKFLSWSMADTSPLFFLYNAKSLFLLVVVVSFGFGR